ncbi:class I SAM-dependent methyltransferase [Nitrobacter winogradskyi]|uniref:SAM-dependent methyltransferase n=2 Tax=Nitrobacter winogradskyi TaxID=913 RepID=A0ACC6AGG3_NITWI|nr:class I SAM-dependent methyltransferase [Nitrobacter winogradskyi]MCP1998766.1 SAM-dependent methyltransferase [Nitrobacter winogradskyi]GEC14309.1 hypothetical protein NWI01_02010 [Nitrobacter winogradskyi]
MPAQFQDYWDKNIDRWGDKYLDISHGHEAFDRPAWFTSIYNSTIGRIERRLMKERYRRTIAFLDKNIEPGVVFSDLGCGTGIFVVEAAKRGAIVNAIDFSESSLATTRRNVEANAPNADVSYIHADLQDDKPLPESYVALAMGVTPYLTDIDKFIAKAIRSAAILCIQYTDPNHWANRIRRTMPVLDVRSLQYYSSDEVDASYDKHDGFLCWRDKFATGYIDVVTNSKKFHFEKVDYPR